MNTHHQEVKNVGHFCMSIGPFADLPIDQKVGFLSSSSIT